MARVYCDKRTYHRMFGDGVRLDGFIVGIILGDRQRKKRIIVTRDSNPNKNEFWGCTGGERDSAKVL